MHTYLTHTLSHTHTHTSLTQRHTDLCTHIPHTHITHSHTHTHTHTHHTHTYAHIHHTEWHPPTPTQSHTHTHPAEYNYIKIKIKIQTITCMPSVIPLMMHIPSKAAVNSHCVGRGYWSGCYGRKHTAPVLSLCSITRTARDTSAGQLSGPETVLLSKLQQLQ